VRLLAAVLVMSACVPPPAPELDPLNPYGDSEPTPEPWLANADGTYYVQTRVTVDDNAHDTTLRAYIDAPGATLLAAADAADVEALATLEATLPAGVPAQLPAWFDEAVHDNAVGLLGVYAIAASLQALPNEALVESELVIDGDHVSHSLQAIYFDLDPLGDRFELGGVEGEIIDAETTATFTPGTWGGEIELAPHELVVAYGDYSYQLADQRTETLRSSLGGLTMCPLVAVAVANKCGGSCALDVPLLTELCERGLDAMLAETRAQLGQLQLQFTGARIAIVDADHDGSANSLLGDWTMASPGITPTRLEFTARSVTAPDRR
jgi:hypothetical protein